MNTVFIVFSKNYTSENIYDLDLEIVFGSKAEAEKWIECQAHPLLYVIQEHPVCTIVQEEIS